MIKECRVVLHNQAVTVVDYDGTQVQFPATKSKTDVVYVEYSDGKYVIVEKEDYEKSLKPKADKKSKKVKATETDLVEEVVGSEAVENETDEISE